VDNNLLAQVSICNHQALLNNQLALIDKYHTQQAITHIINHKPVHMLVVE